MSEYVYAGLTSQTIDVFIRDSSSTTGQGLSGLAYNSGSLVASYRKGATGTRTAITLATQTVGGAFSSGGFVEIDATNMKGVYRLDLPNAAVDTAGFVTVFLSGATNMVPVALRIDCRALPSDVKQFGGTALTAAIGIPEVKVASIADNAVNASSLATDAVTEIQSGLATQTTANTIANDTTMIREVSEASRILKSTVNDFAATSTSFSTNASGVDNAWVDALIVFTSGNLDGQSKPISSFVDAGGVVTVSEAFTEAPANGDSFSIMVAHIHPISQIQSGLATQASVDTIQSDTNDIQTRLPAALESGRIAAVLDSTAIRAALGMAAADLDTQLDAILAGAGGSGTGARTVTITVNDGTTVLQNATVRMAEGANTFTALTNVSGVAVFNLDDATYTVGVTKSGYSYAGTTLIVNGTETATYSMTVVSVTPPDNPDLSAIVVTCLGTDFEIEAGVTIDLRVKTLPTGSENTTFPGAKQTATSNVNGIATLYGPKNSVCQWKRGKADVWTDITIGSADQTNVTSIIGSP